MIKTMVSLSPRGDAFAHRSSYLKAAMASLTRSIRFLQIQLLKRTFLKAIKTMVLVAATIPLKIHFQTKPIKIHPIKGTVQAIPKQILRKRIMS